MSGESDVEACVRETKEEIGINFNSHGSVKLSGKVADVALYREGRHILDVACFLFTTNRPLKLDPNQEEVQDVIWAPVHRITTPKVVYPIHVDYNYSKMSYRRIFGLSQVVMPAVNLSDEVKDRPFMLWGLTLELTETILGIGPTRLQHPSPVLHRIGVEYKFTERTGILNLVWSVFVKCLRITGKTRHFSHDHFLFCRFVDTIVVLVFGSISYIIIKCFHTRSRSYVSLLN